jgi:hypothetical protein
MIYNVTDKIESESSRSNNFIGPGIHDNCELKHKNADTYPLIYGESAKGKKFAAFHFINDKNEVLIHTEWEPFDVDESKLANKTENQIKRFKHIITKYVPKEKYEGFTAQNFEDFVKKSINILGKHYVGIKVRLKITLNNANYTSLPNYTPFIELMSVPKADSVLSINTAMDKMVKDRPDVEQTSSTNPFAVLNPADAEKDMARLKKEMEIEQAESLPLRDAWNNNEVEDEMPF